MRHHYVAVVGCALVLSGCSARFFADKIDDDKSVVMAGTEQVSYYAHFRKIDVAELIRLNSNTGYSIDCSPAAPPSPPPSGAAVEEIPFVQNVKKTTNEVGLAYANFYKCVPRVEQRERRNRIQSAINTAAARNCEVYKHLLSTVESDTSFGFGSISTITGVLGGVLQGAAPALSAASGMSSGLNAEFSKAFFKDTALPVMFAGIDMKRQVIAQDMSERRKGGIGDYTLEEAIGDSARYNGACSAVEGMSHIKHVIAQPVGLREAQRTIAEASDAQALVKILAMNPDQQVSEMETLRKIREARGRAFGERPAMSGLVPVVAVEGSSPSGGVGLSSQVQARADMAKVDVEFQQDKLATLNAMLAETANITDQNDRQKAQNKINADIASARADLVIANGRLADALNAVTDANSKVAAVFTKLSALKPDAAGCAKLQKLNRCNPSADVGALDGAGKSAQVMAVILKLARDVPLMSGVDMDLVDKALN